MVLAQIQSKIAFYRSLTIACNIELIGHGNHIQNVKVVIPSDAYCFHRIVFGKDDECKN